MHVRVDESGGHARGIEHAHVGWQIHRRIADAGDPAGLDEQGAVAFGFAELIVQDAEADRERRRRLRSRYERSPMMTSVV
ncbi:MAG: hypothetical protein NVSMB21_04430 [Vulcanimicrobiaceae bacterium]